MSRRFLSASTQSPAEQGKLKTPAGTGSIPRFAKPTPIHSTARFTQTPTARRPHDDIDTSFEDKGSSSPPLPSRLRFSSSVSRNRYVISDASDDDDDDILDTAGAVTAEADAEDDLSDLLYLESLRGTKQQATRPPNATNHAAKRVATLSRKRRKLSDAGDDAGDVIAISSSSSPETYHATNLTDDEGFDMAPTRTVLRPTSGADEVVTDDDDDDDDLPSSPPMDLSPTIKTSRFKMTAPAVLMGPAPAIRPSFKLPASRIDSTSEGPSRASLPDAFSPSRRRGKKDYIYGGAADTVRNWVLGLAAEEHQTGQGRVHELRVAEVSENNGEGRCVLVRGEDGSRWLLANDNAGTSSAQRAAGLRKVRPGASIGIRGSSIGLDLNLGSSQLDTEGTESNAQGTASVPWKVGVMWDVHE